MEIKKPSFAALEQQMAKDALEIALKDLHGEITREIERNKKDFSENINKTLVSFKNNLEEHISEALDQKIEFHLGKNFQDINSQIMSRFDQLFSPVLMQTETDMKELREQGQATLLSWKEMMSKYTSLWTRPFFLVFITAVLMGIVTSLISSYLLGRQQRETIKQYQSALLSHQGTIQWYWEREKEREKNENKNITKKKKK